MGNLFARKPKPSVAATQQVREWYPKWASQRQAARRLFDRLDTNGDGLLRGPELRGLADAVRTELGHHGCNKALAGRLGRSILRRHDLDGDRALGIYEFMRWYTLTLPATKIFLDADKSGSGCLRGKAEMRPLADAVRALGLFGDGDGARFEKLGRRIMRRADADGDGRLTLREFLNWFQQQKL